MGKVKIYDIAKKLNLTSKEILERAEALKIEAKSHLSNIDEADAKRIEDSFKSGTKPETKKEEKFAQVIVPDDQLSLAIGKSGQNVRLAAKLTNWKIDIKSETQFREMLAQNSESEA